MNAAQSPVDLVPIRDVAMLFGIDLKTLRRWITRLGISVHDDQIDKRRKAITTADVEVLKAHFNVSETPLHDANGNEDMNERIDTMDRRLDVLSSQVNSLASTLASVQATLATIVSTMTDMVAEISQQDERMAEKVHDALDQAIKAASTLGVSSEDAEKVASHPHTQTHTGNRPSRRLHSDGVISARPSSSYIGSGYGDAFNTQQRLAALMQISNALHRRDRDG